MAPACGAPSTPRMFARGAGARSGSAGGLPIRRPCTSTPLAPGAPSSNRPAPSRTPRLRPTGTA
eukprot:391715-Alexandrium_andersonii.AAC.1